jgi:hypothetical protein
MLSQPWIAVWFCALLSLSAVAEHFLIVPTGSGVSITFFAFLPMCFYFMGLMVWRQQGELNDLRGQIAALKAKSEA